MARIPTTVAQRGLDTAAGTMPRVPTGDGGIGRGLQGIGSAIGQLGEVLHQRQQQLQDFQAKSRFIDLQYGVSQDALRATETMQPGAVGYHDQVVGSFDQRAQQFAEETTGLDPNIQAQYQMRLQEERNRVSIGAARTELTERNKYYAEEIDRQTGLAATAIQQTGAGTLEAYQESISESIAKSGLPPADKERMNRAARAQLQESAILTLPPRDRLQALGVSRSAVPGQGASIDRIGGFLSFVDRTEGGGSYSTLFRHAQRGDTPLQGVDVSSMTIGELKQFSSRSGDYGRWSVQQLGYLATPMGRYQFVGSTMARVAKRMGLPDNTVFTPQVQDAMFENEVQHTLRGAQSRSVQRARLRGVWEGFNNVSNEELDAAIDQFTSGSPGAPPAPQDGESIEIGGDERFADIPFERRQRLATAARNELSQEQRQYASEAQDYIAWLEQGNEPRAEFSAEAVTRALGPEHAEPVIQEIQRAERLGDDVRSMRFGSPEDINAMVASRREAMMADPQNFRQNQRDLSNLMQAIEKRNKALVNDPARFTLQDDNVREKLERAQESGAADDFDRFANATIALQEQMGLDRDQQRVAPLEYVGEQARRLSRAGIEEGGQNAYRQITQMRKQWGKHWPKVLGEMIESGDLPGPVMVMANMDQPGQRRAAEELAEAINVGAKEYRGFLENDQTNEISSRVSSRVTAFEETMLGIPGGEATARAYRESIELLALRYAAVNRENPRRAADRAFDEIIAKAFNTRNGMRIPVDQPETEIYFGAQDRLADIADLPLDLPHQPGLTEEQIRESFIASLQTNSRWVTNADNSGVRLYASDGGLVTSEGEPLEFTWQELATYRRGDTAVMMNEMTGARIDPMSDNPMDVIERVNLMMARDEISFDEWHRVHDQQTRRVESLADERLRAGEITQEQHDRIVEENEQRRRDADAIMRQVRGMQ